jgi:3-(3-hydroxy-phenyl)propionate hydroxylase
VQTSQTPPPAADYDVIVVGLGPIGATLSILLGTHGLRVMALDPTLEPYNTPRAIGFDQEAMRVFQQIGIAPELADITAGYRDSEYRTATGEVIRRFEAPPAPHLLAWPPALTFVQPPLERALRAKAASMSNVELRLGTELVEMETADGIASLTLRKLADDRRAVATARYVVGCDGGNSFVRRTLDIELDDIDFDQPWLVADLLLKDGVAAPGLPDLNVQFCDPARPHTFVYGAQNLRRWEFRIMPGEDPAEMARPETVWRLLEGRLSPDEATLWRTSSYRFHALVARHWRQDNFLLAGDACHMTPPFLAQGMVQGIKDTANLSWKLAAVCNGADPALLDSYETERRPHVIEVISTTKALGCIIGQTDPALAAQRDVEMLALMRAGKGVSLRQNLLPPLYGGVLTSADKPQAPVGTPAPQPFVMEGGDWQRLDDVTGAVWRLLALPSLQLDAISKARLQQAGIAVHVIAVDDTFGALREQDTVFAKWAATHGIEAILVRPDHLVFAEVKNPSELVKALDTLSELMPA